MSGAHFAEVAVPVPVHETYTYRIPANVRLFLGARVQVPYGRRLIVGTVVALHIDPPAIRSGVRAQSDGEGATQGQSAPLVDLPGGRPRPEARSRQLDLLTLDAATKLPGQTAHGGSRGQSPSPASESALRSIVRVLDDAPRIPERLLHAVLLAARASLSPPGLALAAALPPGTAPGTEETLRLTEPGRMALVTGQVPVPLRAGLEVLVKGELAERRLRTVLQKAKGTGDPILHLRRLGWIERSVRHTPARVRPRHQRVYSVVAGADLEEARKRLHRAPKQWALLQQLARRAAPVPACSSLRALLDAGWIRAEEKRIERHPDSPSWVRSTGAPELTSHQRAAVEAIRNALVTRAPERFLLYGITGSGKTEVYLRAAQHALAERRGVIVLVPEISLTHQIVACFRSRFGDRAAILHSGLSDGERLDQWQQIRSGQKNIAIGARSAVFAPFEQLGLIVIDEEHDPAYKSEEVFQYDARDLGHWLAEAHRCPLVLGSATPDIETAYHTTQGRLKRLDLPERVARRVLPEVEIVDMERQPRGHGRSAILSRPLRRALEQTLSAGQQAILFVNRRGFATRVYCFACGHAMTCKHCDISLVYHASDGPRRSDRPEQGELRCHYCGYHEPPPRLCPGCGRPDGALLGFGTERVEEEVAALFPKARLARLDRDTSQRKRGQQQILSRFHRGETDVLIGTQMVAKGHDVPNVTLVGVLAADLGLHFPDYRASERTFQLLTQVAGRAGRGDDPGRVVIQTFLPDHYAIALARAHDYRRFYQEELRRRKPHGYPPFRSLLLVSLAAPDAGAVEREAQRLATLANSVAMTDSKSSPEVLGPAPAPVPRVRDQHRMQILLLGEQQALHAIGQRLLASTRSSRAAGRVRVRVVPAPAQML